jgi:hypothetical protein
MKKRHKASVRTETGSLVHQLEPGCPEAREFVLEILYDKREVMDSFSPLLNELGDWRFHTCRRGELNRDPTRFEGCCLDLLVGDFLLMIQGPAKERLE